MIYPSKTDLVPLLENLIAAIQPYAKANNIKLHMVSSIKHVEVYHHPEIIIPDLTRLICRIIAFTPQDFWVELNLPEQDFNNTESLLIIIKNTGASLVSLRSHILNEIKLNTTLQETEKKGTQFLVHIPVPCCDESVENELVPSPDPKTAVFDSPFYSRLKEHLKNHFSSIRNLEKTADAISQRNGIFLKKVNTVILTQLANEDFDPLKLGQALALSRTQLYRRLKPLIGFSPAYYIRNMRLNKAKEFLEKEDLTVSEVAYKTGFASHSHFTRAFRKQFGIKPSEKKQLQNNNNCI